MIWTKAAHILVSHRAETSMSGPRHLSAYSSRAKIGLIVPPTNTVNEAEWGRMMPDGVTFHTVRMPLHAPGHGTTIDAVAQDIAAKAGELTPAGVDVVAYACTAGSMVTPPDALCQAASALAGVPIVTTAAAIVAALRSLGARRLSIATPYHDALNDHEVAFLEAAGFEVLAIAGLGIGANGPSDYPRIARTPLEAVKEHARAVFVHGSDALLITCTDFPTLPLIEPLERELGVPVVTSNQATLWEALRTAGLSDRIAQAGTLLSAPHASRAPTRSKENAVHG
jgi:maleate cis-trans isomerase